MKFLPGIIFFLLNNVLGYGFLLRGNDGGSRIVGGIPVPISEAPYQVSLLYAGFHTCGGSIISRNFVLTACHCTYRTPASYLSVRVGSQDLGKGGEVFKVATVINHPSFNTYSFDFDFALLKLSSLIKLDGKTKAIIPLPTANQAIADNTAVSITGWGETQNSKESNKVLRSVIVPTINQAKCDNIYYFDGGVTSRMVCAGSAGKDSCTGDSGGPMKRQSDGVLIGIVSFGIGCADVYYPGVYSRVASVRPWIKTNAGV